MRPPVDPRKTLEGLVEHFDRSLSTLKSANYNETQARRAGHESPLGRA